CPAELPLYGAAQGQVDARPADQAEHDEADLLNRQREKWVVRPHGESMGLGRTRSDRFLCRLGLYWKWSLVLV
ncbi:MAG: hypothetical protein AAF583_14410, partial [Pseudomonadota bacterium]